VLQSGRELGGWETSRRGVRSAEGLGGRLGGLAAGPGEAMAGRRRPAGSTVGEKNNKHGDVHRNKIDEMGNGSISDGFVQ